MQQRDTDLVEQEPLDELEDVEATPGVNSGESKDVEPQERFDNSASDTASAGEKGDSADESIIGRLDGSPLVLSRNEHSLSQRNIDSDCLKVLYRLQQHGYMAFLVGGGVRDLLLGRVPKDFDVATDARPEDVRRLFRNSRIIGRRFRLNQVYFGAGKIIEVATFRAQGEEEDDSDEPNILQADNTYGTPESDAKRRDLTINGLFYDAKSHAIIDYVGGVSDLQNGIVRMIGDPERRFTEDPVRMIRAVRHAARTQFKIEDETWNAIISHGHLMHHCARSRIHEELLKDLRGGHSRAVFLLLHESGLLRHFMPRLATSLDNPSGRTAVAEVFDRIDQSFSAKREVATPVLFLAPHLHLFPPNTSSDLDEIRDRIIDIFDDIGITRREREGMEQILSLALRLFDSTGNTARARTLSQRQLFPAALQLIELTCTNHVGNECLDFWADFEPPKRANHSRPRYRGRRRNQR